MKRKEYYLSYLILYLSLSSINCSLVADKAEIVSNSESIIFTSSFADPNDEIVVKDIMRESISDDEYYVLSQRDSISFETKGRSVYSVGIRNRVLKTIVVDQTDHVHLTIDGDSIIIESELETIDSNISWYDSIKMDIEQNLKSALSDLVSYPDSSLYRELINNPLRITNDFEIMLLYLKDPYLINFDLYNRDRKKYDRRIQHFFESYDSLLRNSNLDAGSKQIADNELLNATIDKINRLRSNQQRWLYDYLLKEMEKDCEQILPIVANNFLLTYLTSQNIREISNRDLISAYTHIDSLPCISSKRELKMLCILSLYENGNEISRINEVLLDYMSMYQDTVFYNKLDSLYSVEEVNDIQESGSDVLVGLDSKHYLYDDLIDSHNGKVLLIDFWASWCAPCRKGLPLIKQLQEKYGNELDIVYLSIDKYPNPWKRATIDEGLVNSYWINDYVNSDIRKLLKPKNIPHYAIYDKNGNLVFSKINRTESLEGYINELLK